MIKKEGLFPGLEGVPYMITCKNVISSALNTSIVFLMTSFIIRSILMKTATTLPSKIARRFILSLACLAAAFLSAQAQNLVTNSNFTGGSSTGWSTGCTIEINPETAYGGPDASIYVTEIDVERCINQQVCILPGLSYTFTYKASRRTQGSTPANPDIQVKVTGVNSNTNYVNAIQVYSNTTWNLQAQTFTINVPLASGDKKLNIQFLNHNNTGTYGVVLSDIQLAPAASNALSISGPATSVVASPNNFSLTNSPSSGVIYNWSFAGGATPSSSSIAAPLGVKWSSMGTKAITVAIGNGTCTMASYSQSITISALLPVEITGFQGALKGGMGLLSWTTGSETGNTYFVIERSGDGSRFDSIGALMGTNNVNAHSYAFTDAQVPDGGNYYRLRQVDRNGSARYSRTILLFNEDTNAAGRMQVFPNPAGPIINVAVSSPVTELVSVQIFSLSGNMVKTEQQSLSAGNNQWSMAIAGLTPGSYFLKLSSAQGTIRVTSLFTKR